MPKTILVVDDSAPDRATLQGFLCKEYTVIEADCATDMLSVLRQSEKEIAVILLNPVLPDAADGFEALRKIRDNAAYRQIPVIVLSSKTDEKMQATALSLGAVGFMFKPYKKNTILSLMNSLQGTAGAVKLMEKADAAMSQKQLSSQRDRITSLLDNTPSGIAIFEVNLKDIAGTLHATYYNDRFIGFCGYSRAEYDALHEKNELASVFGEDIPALLRDAGIICGGKVGASADTLIRCHKKGGGFRWLLLTGKLAERHGDLCVINVAIIDSTEQQEAIDRQRISEEMLRIAAETDRRSMKIYDVKNNTCRAESKTLFSAKHGEVFENIPQSLIDMKLTAPGSENELRSLFAHIREGKKHICVSLEMHSGPDKYEWFECNATTVFDSEGLPDHAILAFHNITEQRIKEAVFKKWQQSIVSRPPESYTLFRCNLSRGASLDRRDGELLKLSIPSCEMTFNKKAEYYAQECVYPSDRQGYVRLLNSDTLLALYYRGELSASLEYRETSGNGEVSWRRLTVELVEYPGSTDVQAFIMFEDIDEEKKNDIAMLELAKSDPLTGALTQNAFAEKVDELICDTPNAHCALIKLDMDGFRQINDTFGHAAGDEALQEVVAVLHSYSRNGDLVCRLGGDEFLVWLRDVPYDAVIGKTAEQMCEHIRKAYSQKVLLSASAGIAVYPRDGQNYGELYINADKALYKVKQAGKGSCAFYSSVREEQTAEIAEALSAVKASLPSASGAKRRILIVDDNAADRLTLKNIFNDEYLIETAKSGAEAMIQLRHFGASVSVVLLDLMMPDIDGFEVLRRMQNEVTLRTIPVIIVTDGEDHKTLLKGFDLGAAEFVAKPIDVDLVRMRVQAVISKAENERLRAQNSYLMLQRDEEIKYRTVLESTGTLVVEYDRHNRVYNYDGEISKYIAGDFNHRGLWQVLLSDKVAGSADVKALQNMLQELSGNASQKHSTKLVRLRTPNGEKHWFRVNFYKNTDESGLSDKLIITFNDVNEEVLANDRLLFQATRDELTGLYNRTGFLAKATELISSMEPGYYVMSCIDVEKFQVINDWYGIDKGDEVLRHIADSVCGFIKRQNGLCCRYTADKFAVLYPAKLIGSEELDENHRIVAAPPCIPRPLRLRIGRCLVKDTSLPVNAIFDRAAMAEELAKERYDTNIIDYDESMREKILEEQQIMVDMVDALKNGEFVPWFQPQYNHDTGALIGAEALVRWCKNGNIIPPKSFIPLFEKNGFIYEVDQSIWRQVCVLLRRWLDEGKNPLPISVNVSRYDMFQENFIAVITGLIAEYRLPVGLLRLEITESAFSAATDTITGIAGKLIDAGFTVEIDDFGSGYSSLNTLKDVPASILKLDMRFFERTANAKRGGNIVESVVRMAKWLGMAVIAEGVEDEAQADYLKSIGCFYIQGYFYAKPMPADEYEALLASGAKETHLTHLQTLHNLDNNNFWDSHSMDTLIFNSYVGAACILEIYNGKVDMLRATDHYVQMLGGDSLDIKTVLAIDWVAHMDGDNFRLLINKVNESAQTNRTVTGEYEFKNLPGCTETVILRSRMRVIATAGERILVYCLNDNITKQRVAERAALNASERINAVMDNSHCGISAAIPRENGLVELIFVNNRFFEILGYTREQYEKEVKSPYDRVVPEDRNKVFKTVTKLKKIGSTVSFEAREMRRDGKIIWIRCDASIVKFANVPEPVQLNSYLDITEQKETELKQLESARRLEIIMANVNGGISAVCMKNDKPDYIFANEQYYRMLGYTKEEFEEASPNPFDLLHPDDRERVIQKFTEKQKVGEHYTTEYRIVRHDGSLRYIMCSTNVVYLLGIDRPVLLSASNDITKLREIQHQEIAASERLNAVMNSMSNGMTAVAFHGHSIKFMFANNRFYDMHGLKRSDNIEDNLSDVFELVAPEYRERLKNAIYEAVGTSRTICTEYPITRSDGSVCWLRINISMTHLTDIEDPVQVAIYSDITEEKKADEQIRFLNDSASIILAQPNSEKAINDILRKLLEYFASERTYIFELNDDTRTSDNTYELCAPGIISEIDRLQNVPYETQQYWFDAFNKDGFVAIPDVSAISNAESAMRKLLLAQNIHSIIVAPLWRDDALIGYIGVDNPGKAVDQVSQLIALTDYIAVLLTRRDLMKAVEYGQKTAQQLIDDTPGGFLNLELFEDKKPAIIRFNEGLCRMLDMTREEVIKTYGSNVYDCLVDNNASSVAEEIRKSYSSGGQFTRICRLRRKDGELLWVMLFGRFVRSEAGKLYLNAYFTDVTKQRSVEQQQIDLLDNLPFGAAMLDYDGNSLTAIHLNKSYWKLVGRNALISVIDAVHPDDRAAIMEEVRASIRQKRNPETDCRILSGDGGYLPFHIVGTIKPKENGHWMLCLGYSPIDEEKMSMQEMLPIALATMVSSSADMSYVKDKDLRYICVSPSIVALAGAKSPDDLVGKSAEEVFVNNLSDKFNADDKRIIDTGEPVINAFEHITSADGKIRLARTSKYPILNASGHAIGLYCVSQDITAQKEKESQLKLLTDSIPGGIATFRVSRKKIELIYCNDGIYLLAGYSREEYEANPIPLMDLIFAEDKPVLNKQIELMQNGTKNLNFTVRIHTKNGGYKWINDVATVADKIGSAYIVNTVLTDVTEQQEEKERLRLAEEEYRIATEHSERTICRYNIADMSLKVAYEAAARLALPSVIHGVPYEQANSGSISPDTLDNYISFFERVLRGEKESACVFCKKLNNRWRWLSARSTSIFDRSGKPLTAIMSFTDITEAQEKEIIYKKWEQSLTERKPEKFTLYRYNLNRDASYDTKEGSLFAFEVKNKNDMKFNECTNVFCRQYVVEDDRNKYIEFLDSERLLAEYHRGVRSGELIFRAMLTGSDVRWIRLSVELLEYPDSTDIEAYLMYEDINNSVLEELQIKKLAETDSLTGLQNRKVFIERVNGIMEAGKTASCHALFLLDIDCFKHINDTFGHGIGDEAIVSMANIILSVIRDDGFVCRLGGDEFLVYLPDMKSRDSVAKKAKELCDAAHIFIRNKIMISISIGIVSVTDDGDNFDSMYRKADKALYYVKGHGKDNFVFYDASMEKKDDDITANAVGGYLTSLTNGKHTMLIVDDSPINRLVYAGFFRNELTVAEADNGQAALDYLREHCDEVAVVLLDTMMPVMDGYQLLEAMRAVSELREIPVVVISEEEDRQSALKAVKAGASEYIMKPIDSELLRLRVCSALIKAESGKLRKQNYDYAIDNQELQSYRSLMDSNATVLIEYSANTGSFKYAPKAGDYLNGKFDGRPLWQIFSEDAIASEADAEAVRKLITESDKPCKAVFNLKTPDGTAHPFLMKVSLRGVSQNDDMVLITLTGRS